MYSFTKILSLYLLALTLLPCGDGGGGIVDIWENHLGIEFQVSSDHDHQHSNECGDDPCSPLCSCSCCSMVLDVPESQEGTTDPIGLVFDRTPRFIPDFIATSFHSGIWQPPRTT